MTALLLTLALVAQPATASEPPPLLVESSAQLSVQLLSLTCDVYGGDGDNLPAIWTLYVNLRVTNTGDEPATVTSGAFVLPLPGDDIRGKLRGATREIAPGASAEIVLERYMTLDQLSLMREGFHTTVAERTPRKVSGQLDFEVGGRARYVPFTVVGRYRDVTD